MNEKSLRPESLRAVLMYSVLGFPLAFAGLPIYLHAPDFYATQMGLSLTVLGIALLVLRAVDAVQDPLIGALSDRFHGFRHFIILLGIVMLGGGLWMVFHPTQSFTLAWFCAAVFICTTGYSIVSINFLTLGGVWKASESERTKITGWREGVILFGVLCAAVAPQLMPGADDTASKFHMLTLVYIPILALAAFVFFIWMHRALLDEAQEQSSSKVPTIFGHSWRRQFFGIYLLSGFANAIPGVLFIFFVRDRLGAEELVGIFLLTYFATGALSMPVWQFIAKRSGKVQAWLASMVLAIVTFFGASFLGNGDIIAFGIICLMSGCALGADLCLPPSLLADHISHTSLQSMASRFFAIMTFLSKASLALATGLMFLMLGGIGYQPGEAVSDSSSLSLAIAYATVPCIIKVICTIWLWRSSPKLAAVQD